MVRAHGPAAEDTDAFPFPPRRQQPEQAGAGLRSPSRGGPLPAPTSGAFAAKKEEEEDGGKAPEGSVFCSPVRQDGGR